VKLLIVNTYSDFRGFWKLAENSASEERLRLYDKMYVAKHREFFDVYFWKFGSRKRLLEALMKYEEIGAKLEEASSRVERVIERTLSKASEAFEVYDVDLDFVLLLGTFSTDGFTVPFKQSQTIFIALEVVSQYPESLLAVLVAHEISHGFHATILSRTFSKYNFQKLPPLPNLIRLDRLRPQGLTEVFRPRFWRAIPVIRTMMKDMNWIATPLLRKG
jgi:hypothetical protein